MVVCMLSLGENLARIRTARGLTQNELSRASGVSVDTISRLERGTHTTARRSTLQALSVALGTDPGRLLGIHPPEQDTASAEQLRRAVHALDLPDRVDETGVFGPRVAAMQAVDTAMRTGDPDRAMTLAAQAPATAGAVPAFWESGHRLHLAAACTDLERWGEVVEHLDAARTLAPQWSRVQPLGHTVVSQLVEHRGRRSERIGQLAAHYGT